MVIRLRRDDGGLVLNRGNGWRSLDGERLVTSCIRYHGVGRVVCQEGLVSQREDSKREPNELGVGPSNPTTSMPGKFVFEAVSIAPAGGYWNAVVSPANVEALGGLRP